MRAQFARTMHELGLVDPNLVVLVGDIGVFGLREFAKSCPNRFFNYGIREQSMISAAAGLALEGFHPVVHSITPFVVERCFEQIKVDFSYHEVSGNIVSIGGGIDYSALGGTHHSYSDLALMKSLPGSKVFVPGNPQEFDYLFRKNYNSNCVNYFRLSDRSHIHPIPIDEFDRISVVKSGKDCTIVTMGPLLSNVLAAVENLDASVSCEVLYVNTLKPFDCTTVVKSLHKTRKALVVEDHIMFGGLTDEVRRALTAIKVPFVVDSLTLPDKFIREYGPKDYIAKLAGLDPHSIAKKICSMSERRTDEFHLPEYSSKGL